MLLWKIYLVIIHKKKNYLVIPSFLALIFLSYKFHEFLYLVISSDPIIMNSFIMNFFFRFFLGSNKVMQVSLGRSAADEITPGIHKVSKVSTLFHGGNNYYCSVFPINLHCYASCLLPFLIPFFSIFFLASTWR